MNADWNHKIQAWVESFIIGQNICPFAKQPWTEGKVGVVFFESDSGDKALDSFLGYVETFHNTSSEKLSNALLVFPNLQMDFFTFFSFVEEARDLLVQLAFQDEYELVCFHPRFHFEGEQAQDRGSLVNQSPWPLIHLLRKEELYAVADSEQGLAVANRNKEFLENLDEEEFENLKKIVRGL